MRQSQNERSVLVVYSCWILFCRPCVHNAWLWHSKRDFVKLLPILQPYLEQLSFISNLALHQNHIEPVWSEVFNCEVLYSSFSFETLIAIFFLTKTYLIVEKRKLKILHVGDRFVLIPITIAGRFCVIIISPISLTHVTWKCHKVNVGVCTASYVDPKFKF